MNVAAARGSSATGSHPFRCRVWPPVSLAVALVLGAGGQLAGQHPEALRSAVERTGGSLRTDEQGQPLEVDWTGNRGAADAAAFEAVLACTRLQVLRARVTSIPAEQLVQIASLVSLRELSLQDAALGDDDLAKLAASLQGLERLALRNAPKVTDRGIAAMVKRSSLTHLALIELPLTDSALPAIASLPALAALDLRQCSQVTASGLRALGSAAALREIKIGGQGIDDNALAAVAKIPQLSSLTVEDASIGPEGLTGLIQAPGVADRLQAVSLARCLAIDDAALESLARLPQLTQLRLRDMPVTGRFLRTLPNLNRLETLVLNQTFLVEEAFASIALCRNLKRLELAQNPLSREALQAIGKLPELEYLNLTECGLDDTTLAALAGHTRLKTLVVDGNPALSARALNDFRLRN